MSRTGRFRWPLTMGAGSAAPPMTTRGNSLRHHCFLARTFGREFYNHKSLKDELEPFAHKSEV